MIGDERGFFLLYIAGRGQFPAADPACDLGLVSTFFFVMYQRRDAITASDRCLEFASDRLFRRIDLALLHIGFFFDPFAVFKFPLQARGADFDGLARNSVPIQVGDDQVDLQGLAALDEIALTAHAHVQVCRMHQQTGRAGPGLTVDVRDGAFRRRR